MFADAMKKGGYREIVAFFYARLEPVAVPGVVRENHYFSITSPRTGASRAIRRF
jgi:hypothetical protein